MDCPACKNPLAVLEFDAVEVDQCPECGGVWLDVEEAALLFGSASQTEDFLRGLASGAKEEDRRLHCPISGKRMRKSCVRGSEGVTLDVSAFGVWFDRGELAAVLEARDLPPRLERVAQWLREVFGAKMHG